MSYKDEHFTDNSINPPITLVGEENVEVTPLGSNNDVPFVGRRKSKTKWYFKEFIIFCIFSGLCGVLLFVFLLNETFSEFFARYISGFLRMLLTAFSSLFPFSLAESLILLIPVGVVIFYIFFLRSWKSDPDIAFKKYMKVLVCFILCLFDLFTLTIAPCYHRLPLSENLMIEEKPITTERLKRTSEIMVDMLNENATKIYYGYDGLSYSRNNFSDLAADIGHAYDKFAAKYPFVYPVGFPPKQLALGEAITYLHVSGVYSYFTGEANINTNYPDYILPHTVAHELSHARGVLKEGDANFVGFLVCLESDNPYVKYSGLMNIFPYIANALYSASPDVYIEVMSGLSYNILGDYTSFANFFAKYEKSTAAKVSGVVNDAFLKVNGQSDGIESYGLVVDLTVNYLEGNL